MWCGPNSRVSPVDPVDYRVLVGVDVHRVLNPVGQRVLGGEPAAVVSAPFTQWLCIRRSQTPHQAQSRV